MLNAKKKQYELFEIFGQGNEKLGKVITFSIPAIETCPGRSKLCEGLCYATGGRFLMPNVKKRLNYNWQLSRRSDFADIASAALKTCKWKDPLLRIHPSGDFYSVQYIRKWYKILKANPKVRAWYYTRSWRKPKLLRELLRLNSLDNVRPWFSSDSEIGEPDILPPKVRTAYLMMNEADIPDWKPDLLFRDYPMRKGIAKHINGVMVCPPENGVSTNVHCDRCRICIRDEPVPVFNDPVTRISLKVV